MYLSLSLSLSLSLLFCVFYLLFTCFFFSFFLFFSSLSCSTSLSGPFCLFRFLTHKQTPTAGDIPHQAYAGTTLESDWRVLQGTTVTMESSTICNTIIVQWIRDLCSIVLYSAGLSTSSSLEGVAGPWSLSPFVFLCSVTLWPSTVQWPAAVSAVNDLTL